MKKKTITTLLDSDENTSPVFRASHSPDIFPVQHIAVKSIDKSPANKRIFPKDNKKLLELGESIKSQGLLQAIVIRKKSKKNGRFELVAGERRWRAFVIMGWKFIPAIIRDLTDSEAHDITTAENLQREDLSPIEEAESIQVLIDDGREPQEIADKHGKTVGWVVQRARIAGISKKWKEAISNPAHIFSKWNASHLQIIARYSQSEQDEIFDEYVDEWDAATITVKDLENALNSRLLLMKGAPWKLNDETLLPKAGSCITCQKRTSCQLSLFEPVDENIKITKDDKCTDRECWGKKLIAYHEIKIKEASEKHSNLKLIVKDGANALPDNHPWRDSLTESWKYQGTKKSDPDAVPVYVLDGPGAGRIEYQKLSSYYSSSGSKRRKIGKDGKPVPKTLEERREGLQKRRIIRYVNKLMLILSGENPSQTGAKKGVCQICGCTEDNCSSCIERTGEPCHWIDDEKTICSACKDNVTIDRREEIAFNLSHIEAHALCAAFGAASSDIGDEENIMMHEFDRWKVYSKVVEMNGCDAIKTSIYGVFSRIVEELRQITYAQEPDIEFPNQLCAALRLDREAIWSKVLEEIPEPKSWAKLEEIGIS